jgi:XapX domain-containing protein
LAIFENFDDIAQIIRFSSPMRHRIMSPSHRTQGSLKRSKPSMIDQGANMYLISLGAGLLVGAIYGLMGVRSPAPPVIALIGLLGMLVGEQIAGTMWQNKI